MERVFQSWNRLLREVVKASNLLISKRYLDNTLNFLSALNWSCSGSR